MNNFGKDLLNIKNKNLLRVALLFFLYRVGFFPTRILSVNKPCKSRKLV